MNRSGTLSTATRSCRQLFVLIPGLLLATALCSASTITLASPSNTIVVTLDPAAGHLRYSISHNGRDVLKPSTLGITIDGVDLGSSASLGQPARESKHEVYPWLGARSSATNHCNIYRVPVTHEPSKIRWTLEFRVFDDGAAYRYLIPGTGSRRIYGESSSWSFPSRSRAWFQSNIANYENEYESALVESIPTAGGPNATPLHLGLPVTIELPDGAFALISEADLENHSGLVLKPTGSPRLEAAFPFDPEGWEVAGNIQSPWRVTLVSRDLHDLVNSDIISSLNPPPDPALFPKGPHTDWIVPGRALDTWTIFGNDGAQWHRQKWFIDQCAALNCEFLLLDAGWRTERWGWLANNGDVWARLRELCEYGAAKNVGIIAWNAYPDGRDDGPGLTTPGARRDFIRRCREAGVKGIKIDFFDREDKATVEVYEEFRRLTAEARLLISFHGANKPTGETRTWPHETTREGIREQEYLLWDQMSLTHYTALPFTRMAVGHSDFLPTYVRQKYLKNTTATFQMATAVVATSPFLCWPDHPDDYLASPFVDLIKRVPVVWDETRVLPGSDIGQFVAFARRSGQTWFVAILNGATQPRTHTLQFDFLDHQPYTATFYRDVDPWPTGLTVTHRQPVTSKLSLPVNLSSGGGFVAWLKPATND
jgi:alpha-glucosidase